MILFHFKQRGIYLVCDSSLLSQRFKVTVLCVVPHDLRAYVRCGVQNMIVRWYPFLSSPYLSSLLPSSALRCSARRLTDIRVNRDIGRPAGWQLDRITWHDMRWHHMKPKVTTIIIDINVWHPPMRPVLSTSHLSHLCRVEKFCKQCRRILSYSKHHGLIR